MIADFHRDGKRPLRIELLKSVARGGAIAEAESFNILQVMPSKDVKNVDDISLMAERTS